MNKRAALFLSSLVLMSIIIQVSSLPVFLRSMFRPDFLLIIVVFVALRGTFVMGAPLAWLIGMLNDVFSGLYLGLNAFTFLISFLFIKSFSDRLYADSAILFILAVVGVTLASCTINLLLLMMFTASPDIAHSMFSDIFPRLLVNAFIASVVTVFPGFDCQLESE